MNLEVMRDKIDAVDQQLVALFLQRMQLSSDVASYKREQGLPVLDAERERALLTRIGSYAGEENSDYARSLYETILTVSRSRQNQMISPSAVTDQPYIGEHLPAAATIACQGTECAFSHLACQSLFSSPKITFFSAFDEVFSAVESGACHYGILPIENSTAGSVNKTYDLMGEYSFSIVGSVRLRVCHNLLAKPGVTLSNVCEVLSHEQALRQCSNLIGRLQLTATPCSNTAVAAKTVSESARNDLAAIASFPCAERYGLSCLVPEAQNKEENFTRFICIARRPALTRHANRTSILITLPHKSGCLRNILTLIATHGANLTKLESRPHPEAEFEFLFYIDFELDVSSPRFVRLMTDLEAECEQLRYLGTYEEVAG